MNSDGNENEMTVANNYVTAEQIADHRWSPITELPAIFFAKVGAAVMLNRKRLCRFPFLLDNNTMAYSLSPTKWDADFAKALFGTVDLTSLVQVGALPSYNAGDVESMEIYLPSLLEQEQIGAYFKHLDHLITLHQRKCALIFSSFQALISMMFTTSTFSWEQRKVGDLLIERNQQAPMSDEYPLMAFIANEGVAPKGERYDRSALVTDTVNKLYKKTEKGDFIYSSNNLETGSIGLNKYGKACISPVYSIFEPTGIADSDFLGRRLVRKDFINAMVKWRQGVIYGQWRIHESDFLKIEIPVPSVEEQQKIGAYLDQLDNLITLHQRQPFLHSTPEISLTVQLIHPFYTSSWEQRKLGELVDRVVRKNINNESTLPLTISAQYGLVDQITYFNNRVASRDVSNYYFNIAVPHIRGFRSNLRCTGLPDSYHRSFPQRYKRYRFRLFGQCRCGRIVHPADPTNPCYPNQRK